MVAILCRIIYNVFNRFGFVLVWDTVEAIIVLKEGYVVISELITAEILKNVGLTIGQYIFGQVGDI